MARYIDIEGAGIGKANREQFLVPEFADGWNAVLKILEKEPTADVAEVRHGHWIEMSKDSVGKAFMCSVCGAAEVTDSFDKSPLDNSCNYCYRCGAKMDGKGDA